MTTLGDLVIDGGIQTGPFGSQLHASDYTPQGVGVVMPQDIGDNVVVPDSMARIDPDMAESLSRHQLVPGDIVFSRRGDVTRRALIRSEDGELLCGTGCLRVRLDGKRADSVYVSYSLALKESRDWLVRHAVGATMPNLNTGILSGVPLRVPELHQQRAVSQVLGALDDRIAANQKVTKRVLTLGEYLVRNGPLIEKVLIDVATVIMGSSPRGESLNEGGEGMRFYQGVRDFGTIFPMPRVSTSSPVRTAPAGATLLAVRAPVGEVNLAVEKVCIGRGLAGIAPKENPAILHFCLRAFQDIWDEHQGGGTVFASVNGRDVREARLPMPEDSEGQLERRLASLLDRAVQAEQESVRLAATRDELLPLLMSGKITVKDAEKTVEGVL